MLKVLARSMRDLEGITGRIAGLLTIAPVDHRAEDATRGLGATELRAFAGVTLLALAPAPAVAGGVALTEPRWWCGAGRWCGAG